MLRNMNGCPFQYRLSEMIYLFDELMLYIQQAISPMLWTGFSWRADSSARLLQNTVSEFTPGNCTSRLSV